MLTSQALDDVYRVLPIAAVASTTLATVLFVRSVLSGLHTRICRHRLPRFGRKASVITGASTLFAWSCTYRSVFIADEGAFKCRDPATIFNAPVSGRFVATIGELALVIQLYGYLSDTACRLRVKPIFTSSKRHTVAPALLAEGLSWTGVLSGCPFFFCLEYMCWMALGCMWAWDSAELLHRSSRRGDGTVHASIMVASLLLVAFNALHEIPHFFFHHELGPETIGEATPEGIGPWACEHDADSHLWHKRLPFFVCYFFISSWSSVGLAMRYCVSGRS